MKITQVKIQNFKAFKGENTFDLNSGLVFLVGENNTGKTTLLEAISFLKSGLPEKRKIEDFKNKQAIDERQGIAYLRPYWPGQGWSHWYPLPKFPKGAEPSTQPRNPLSVDNDE